MTSLIEDLTKRFNQNILNGIYVLIGDGDITRKTTIAELIDILKEKTT